MDLDLNPDTKSSFSTWGNNWTTGGAWDSGGKPPEEDADKKEDAASSPWSINRPKPKKKNKTNLAFGSFDDIEEQNEVPANPIPNDDKDDGFGFTVSSSKKDKKKKKSNMWDIGEEDPKDEPAVDTADTGDAWGWSSSSKKKGKKNEPEFVEPEPEPAPPPPV